MSQEPGTNRRTEQAFSQAERDAVYRAIFERRDVRSQFRADPLPEEVLLRILTAAHHAPSVGFMQPWDFIVIDDPELKRVVRALYKHANERAARHYDGDRGALYRQLKLEGILDSPINLVVTCDRTRGGPHVLGRDSSLDMDLFSTCLAVQNLWLAARAEGVGVGWVSILDEDALARLLKLPEDFRPLAVRPGHLVSNVLELKGEIHQHDDENEHEPNHHVGHGNEVVLLVDLRLVRVVEDHSAASRTLAC